MTSTDTIRYPIRDAFRKFYPAYLAAHPDLEPEKRKAASCIMDCKTGELGYNYSYCEKCGHAEIHAVSCNNRSCPCCQSPLEKKWEMERNTELIEGIAYYHVVFTLPHDLNDIIYHNRKLLLGLLFRCVHETLLTLCADPRHMGAKPGIVSVLHTWGQRLNFHPHIHVCLSGGGITPDGRFAETKHKGFFLPQAAVASMFRGKFLCALKDLYTRGLLNLSGTEDLKDKEAWRNFINSLFEKRWLPFIKETFNGKGNAIKYLARYSFRTAIANSRILSVTDETVTFKYKDYADNSIEKNMTVNGTEFIDMFLRHILPSGFCRMRSAGYLANCKKTKNLELIHKLRNTLYFGNPFRNINVHDLILKLYNKDICICSECQGRMISYPRGTPAFKLPLPANEPNPAMR